MEKSRKKTRLVYFAAFLALSLTVGRMAAADENESSGVEGEDAEPTVGLEQVPKMTCVEKKIGQSIYLFCTTADGKKLLPFKIEYNMNTTRMMD